MSGAGAGMALAGSQTGVPVAEGERIGNLDLVRGVAVLGILAANIVAFGQPLSATIWPGAFLTGHDPASDWLWVAQFILVDGKMRGLFTLLFGAGLALFMEKAWARGQTGWLQLRRLFWLMAFGLIHYYLIWRGDILVLYSVTGFAAMLFLRLSASAQLMAGVVGYVVGGIAYAAMVGPYYFIVDTALGEQAEFAELRAGLETAKAKLLADDAQEAIILTEGSYPDFVSHNLAAHWLEPFEDVFFHALETLPLMLIGMAVYRFGFFSGRLDRAAMQFWGWSGVIAGSLVTAIIAVWMHGAGLDYWGTVSAFFAFGHLPRLPVIMGLAALLTLWGEHASGWLAQRLLAPGRLAFSNYLGTSLLMLLVFHPWAGALWGELGRAQLYLVVPVAWAVMLGWSKPWLEHFRYGPLEWLWRCLTYGRIFAFRR